MVIVVMTFNDYSRYRSSSTIFIRPPFLLIRLVS